MGLRVNEENTDLPASYEETFRRDFPGELDDDPGTVRWFGRPWPSADRPASICRPDTQIPTPVGDHCMNCPIPIVQGDQGIRVPYLGRVFAYYHLECWMKSLVRDWQRLW
jgi:hypothetical protein